MDANPKQRMLSARDNGTGFLVLVSSYLAACSCQALTSHRASESSGRQVYCEPNPREPASFENLSSEWAIVRSVAGIDKCEEVQMDMPIRRTMVEVFRGVPIIYLSNDLCLLPRECRLAVLAHEAAHLTLQHWQLAEECRTAFAQRPTMLGYSVFIGLCVAQEIDADTLAIQYLTQLGFESGGELIARTLSREEQSGLVRLRLLNLRRQEREVHD